MLYTDEYWLRLCWLLRLIQKVFTIWNMSILIIMMTSTAKMATGNAANGRFSNKYESPMKKAPREIYWTEERLPSNLYTSTISKMAMMRPLSARIIPANDLLKCICSV